MSLLYTIMASVQHQIVGPDREKGKYSDPVTKFEEAIKADPEMLDLLNQAFIQAPEENPFSDFDSLLFELDGNLAKPITLWDNNPHPRLPFSFLINTLAGYDLFRKPKFNIALKAVLESRGEYLADPNRDSNACLTDADGGWFGEPGLQMLESNGRGAFNETYVCPDPNAVNRGFPTFDAFFTRKFQPGVRPVYFPENNTLIHNPCESSVYRIAHQVKERDRFWVKGQYYSLYDMLNRDEQRAKQFAGGTVYQAYLAVADYHRWHAPLDGVVEEVVKVPGTYVAGIPDDGAEEGDPCYEPGDLRGAVYRSMAFLAMVATRALIFIRADNADIGLVCFMAIGMFEVSSCEVTVKEGQKVKAGEELGTFRFGGSGCVMIFGPQACVTFEEGVQVGGHLKVNSIIGQTQKKLPAGAGS